jgi:transglutaminase-like putative cysteine protease
MRLSIAHTTTYRYDTPFAGETYMEARLRPLDLPGEQLRREFRLTTDPAAPVFDYEIDGDAGTVSHFTLRDIGHERLVIHADSIVETLVINPFDGVRFDERDWPTLAEPQIKNDLAEWLAPAGLTEGWGDWTAPDLPHDSVFAFGQSAMRFIYENFEYVPGSTDVRTPLATFVQQRRGVCQDYAHLMIALARAAGVPARYVSGYVFSGSDGNTHGSDATHAWAELYIPHVGVWKGFDPTNNVVVADRHVKIAVGRDYADVTPTKGILRPSHGNSLPLSTELDVVVRVSEV